MIPVSCSLCAWTAEAANSDEACGIGDWHLATAHEHPPDTRVGDLEASIQSLIESHVSLTRSIEQMIDAISLKESATFSLLVAIAEHLKISKKES